MTVTVGSFAFLLAVVCAALMGFAIQRGATCTVAAVGEVVEKGTATKIIALAEACLWVAGGLLIARALGFLPSLPGGFAFSPWTISGAVLLGIGAYINQSCVFGAVARLGSGQWAYLCTPVGFFIGAITAPTLFSHMVPAKLETLPAGSSLPLWLAPVFAAFALWRIFGFFRQESAGTHGWRRLWAPHEATIVIGITFVIMLVVVGAWSYMDLLVGFAHGMADNAIWQTILFAALLLGAVLGGWIGGSFSWQRPRLATLARCLFGGMLMGWGSLLLPGSNDGLILVGIPLLWPYAWISIVTMCVVIWIAFKVEGRFSRR